MRRVLSFCRRPKRRCFFHSLPDIREDAEARTEGAGMMAGGMASGSMQEEGGLANQSRQQQPIPVLVSYKVYKKKSFSVILGKMVLLSLAG